MKIKVYFFILVLLIISHVAVNADTTSVTHALDSTRREDVIPIDVMLSNAHLYQQVSGTQKQMEFVFDIVISNNSLSRKYDVVFPLSLDLRDEFNNTYRNFQSDGAAVNFQKDDDILGLYPGEQIVRRYRFQAPVPTAQMLTLNVEDSSRYFQHEILFETHRIDNWGLISDGPSYSNDDLFIVYPRDKRIFSPGEKVFLKVGFSERAGKPKSIHIILPDYVLTDEKAKGQYELLVPEDRLDGQMQVIVMAEWEDDYQAPQIISKTLLLEIKG